MKDTSRVTPPYDSHLHTWLSPCGDQDARRSAPAVYADRARAMGLEAIGISDHFALPAPGVPKWYENSGPGIIAEARRCAAEIDNGVAVFVGCEADLIAPGRPTIDADFAREVDYVMIAASHFQMLPVRKQASENPILAADFMMRYLEAAVSLPYVDIIAHPLVVPNDAVGPPELYLNLISDSSIRRVSARAAANNIAFEINGHMAGRTNMRELLKRFFLLAKVEGCRFSVGSDSHKVSEMVRLEAVESYARELGLDRGDFIGLSEIVAKSQARG